MLGHNTTMHKTLERWKIKIKRHCFLWVQVLERSRQTVHNAYSETLNIHTHTAALFVSIVKREKKKWLMGKISAYIIIHEKIIERFRNWNVLFAFGFSSGSLEEVFISFYVISNFYFLLVHFETHTLHSRSSARSEVEMRSNYNAFFQLIKWKYYCQNLDKNMRMLTRGKKRLLWNGNIFDNFHRMESWNVGVCVSFIVFHSKEMQWNHSFSNEQLKQKYCCCWMKLPNKRRLHFKMCQHNTIDSQ